MRTNGRWPMLALATALVACNSNSDIPIQQLALDVTAVDVQGDFSLNGNPFPVSQYENGVIAFADSEGNAAPLGNTYDGSYAVAIVAGDYDSTYTRLKGGATVPINRGDVVGSGHALQGDQTLDIDVTAISVRFQFTLNGGVFPVSEYDDAVFSLQPVGGGEEIVLGNSHSSIDPVWLMPGTYQVIYALETGGALVPVNEHAVIDTVVVDNMTSGFTIDVKTVSFRFDATLDGAAFPVSQYEHGRFYLRNSGDGDMAGLGTSYELPLINPVIEGTYDIVYAHQNGVTVPANTGAALLAGVTVDGANPAQTIDILTATVTPQYSLDGGAFPQSEYQDAEIYLRGGDAGDTFYLGNTHDPSPAAVKIVRGNYDVIYRHETGDQVPQNSNTVLQGGVAMNVNQVLVISITSVDITGTFTHNGNGFGNNIYQSAKFFLRGSNADDSFLFGFSYADSSTVKIIPGTYDVSYSHFHGLEVPQNTDKVVKTAVQLNISQSIRVNVSSKRLKPGFTLDGNAFPVSAYHRADFFLRDNSNADRIFLGASQLNNDAILVVLGAYDLLYEHVMGNQVPVNERAVVGSVNVQ